MTFSCSACCASRLGGRERLEGTCAVCRCEAAGAWGKALVNSKSRLQLQPEGASGIGREDMSTVLCIRSLDIPTTP